MSRALTNGDLLVIRAAVAVFPQIDLSDALRIVMVNEDRNNERYDRAVAGWIGRFAL